jgi:hypothetical protein
MANDDDRVEITTFSLPEAVRLIPRVNSSLFVALRGDPVPPSAPTRSERRMPRRGALLTSSPLTFPTQYVYAIPPTATHAGHRADSWNVEKWLKAVRVKVTVKGDRGHIKLDDAETGELFAECPLPRDVPVSTVVEPVVDSSRYFVLRVEDEATRRHAFLGLGFRQRDDASDFKLAVQEHQNRSDREKDAEASRLAYERDVAEKRKTQLAAGIEGPTRLHDFSLKGNIRVAVPGSGGKPGAEKKRASTPETAAPRTLAPPPFAGAEPFPAPAATPDPAATPASAEEGWASFEAPSEEKWADFQS